MAEKLNLVARHVLNGHNAFFWQEFENSVDHEHWESLLQQLPDFLERHELVWPCNVPAVIGGLNGASAVQGSWPLHAAGNEPEKRWYCRPK